MVRASWVMPSAAPTFSTVLSWAFFLSKVFMKIVSFLFAIAALLPQAQATSRLKELVSIDGVRDNQLIGYGLVVGLNGTGDRKQTLFSAQSLANMLARMGVTVDPTQITVKNVA